MGGFGAEAIVGRGLWYGEVKGAEDIGAMA
jgi:hypothetical protein